MTKIFEQIIVNFGDSDISVNDTALVKSDH
jgi:hypothetical protein